MNTFFEELENDRLAADLREAVAGAEFDYPALVAGVHQRAGRIRRRRAIVTGAVAAVVAPALLGGSALVLPALLPGQPPTLVAPAASMSGTARVATAANELTAPGASAPTAPPTGKPTHEGARTPPWQESAPPSPEGGFDSNESVPNAWDIPDARPTGVTFLDSLGAPRLAWNYPNAAPVQGLMTCDPGRSGGIEPVAGQSLSFYPDSGPRLVDLQVTGWVDSQAAFAGLVNDAHTLCVWDELARQQLAWDETPGSDRVLFAVSDDATSVTSAAIIRQGDYLIAVTVSDGPGVATTEVAAEIASKTADNLAALDTKHGRD